MFFAINNLIGQYFWLVNTFFGSAIRGFVGQEYKAGVPYADVLHVRIVDRDDIFYRNRNS